MENNDNALQMIANIIFGLLALGFVLVGLLHLMQAWQVYSPSFLADVEDTNEATFLAVSGVAHILAGLFLLMLIQVSRNLTDRVNAIGDDVTTIKAAMGRLVMQSRKPKE